MSRSGAPEGGAVVLDLAQLEALLPRTFSIGLDVGQGRAKVALVRLRLSKALLAAAELGKAAEALHGLIELAEMTGRSGRTGKTDLN